MELPNNIDLNVLGNRITNIAEIVALLNSKELSQDFIEHIRTLKNRLDSMDLENKSELLNAFDSKIMEFEAKNGSIKSNQEALNMLRDVIHDYQRLTIISTKCEDNDSNKAIDYLTYKTNENKIEMLSCDSETTIQEFIISNTSKLPSMSAEDVFHHFKEYVHREVKFESPEELKNDPDKRKTAIVNDPEAELLELDELKNYQKTYGIEGEITVAIDNNGERIYQVGDGLIKFKTVLNKREMQVLKQPTIKANDLYTELVKELDEEDKLAIQTEEVKDTNKNVRADTYDALPKSFNKERLTEIIAKRDVYDIELAYEEEHELNTYIKFLISHVEESAQAKIPADDTTRLATEIMETARGAKPSLVDAYTSIQKGELKENELNDLEKEFARRYIKGKEEMLRMGLMNNLNKNLTLEPDTKPHGVATVVLLLELIALAMFIMMFLRLDI